MLRAHANAERQYRQKLRRIDGCDLKSCKAWRTTRWAVDGQEVDGPVPSAASNRFRLKSRNGEIVATGESYPTNAAA